MNALTRDIAKWLKIDLDTARTVQSRMAEMGADFSEQSTNSLKPMATEAFQSLKTPDEATK